MDATKKRGETEVVVDGDTVTVTKKAVAKSAAGDIEGQGQYWKTYYNTPLGKGTVTKYVYKVQKILKEAQGH